MRNMKSYPQNITVITFAGKSTECLHSLKLSDPVYLSVTVVVFRHIHKFFDVPPSRR